MEKEVSIQSIKILMGKKEVELSIEEAKKLHKALAEIFQEKIVEKTIHHYDYYRHYDWNRFYVSSQPQKFDFGTVYCSTAKVTNAEQSFKGNATNTLCLDIK